MDDNHYRHLDHSHSSRITIRASRVFDVIFSKFDNVNTSSWIGAGVSAKWANRTWPEAEIPRKTKW